MKKKLASFKRASKGTTYIVRNRYVGECSRIRELVQKLIDDSAKIPAPYKAKERIFRDLQDLESFFKSY
jgi:hypothetical protein